MRLNLLSVCLVSSLLILAACAPAPAPEAQVSTEAESAGSPEPMVSGDRIETDSGDLVIQPLNHATFAMAWDGQTIYVDPVGGAELFEGLPTPNLILITDIHGDHLDAPTLEAIAAEDTVIVAPAAVVEQLSEGLASQARTLANGSETSLLGLTVEAIPMYNLRPSPTASRVAGTNALPMKFYRPKGSKDLIGSCRGHRII